MTHRKDREGVLIGGVVLFVILLAIGIPLIFAYPFMLLWNFVIPGVFGGPIITYWLSVGLLFLLAIVGGMLK